MDPVRSRRAGLGLALVLVLGPFHQISADDAGEGRRMRVIDFGAETEPWRSIDDVVMGGRSSSGMEIEDGVGVFQGEVSLKNNGGFASVRSLPEAADLSAFEGVSLRVRGDGKRYAVRLRTTDAVDGVSYQVKVRPPAGEWHDVTLRFDEFEPVFRGRLVRGHPTLDPRHLRTFGLLIADAQEGEFRLEIMWIDALREIPPRP